jgi:hypothetical protein
MRVARDRHGLSASATFFRYETPDRRFHRQCTHTRVASARVCRRGYSGFSRRRLHHFQIGTPSRQALPRWQIRRAESVATAGLLREVAHGGSSWRDRCPISAPHKPGFRGSRCISPLHQPKVPDGRRAFACSPLLSRRFHCSHLRPSRHPHPAAPHSQLALTVAAGLLVSSRGHQCDCRQQAVGPAARGRGALTAKPQRIT